MTQTGTKGPFSTKLEKNNILGLSGLDTTRNPQMGQDPGPQQVQQVTGINPDKSHGQGPWVSYRKHRLDDKLVGKQEDTFLLDIVTPHM